MARVFISSAQLAARLLPGLVAQFDSVIRDPVLGDFCFEVSGSGVPDTGECSVGYAGVPTAETTTLTPIAVASMRAAPAALPPPLDVGRSGDQVAELQFRLSDETKERERRRLKRVRAFVR